MLLSLILLLLLSTWLCYFSTLITVELLTIFLFSLRHVFRPVSLPSLRPRLLLIFTFPGTPGGHVTPAGISSAASFVSSRVAAPHQEFYLVASQVTSLPHHPLPFFLLPPPSIGRVLRLSSFLFLSFSSFSSLCFCFLLFFFTLLFFS